MTQKINGYTIHQVGFTDAWDVVYKHVTPDYEPAIYSDTVYTFNETNYDIDPQKLYVGHKNEALIAGIQSWLLPTEYVETSFSGITLETLSQSIGDPDLAPYEIGHQGEDVPQRVSSAIFIGEDPYTGVTIESLLNESYTMEPLTQNLLDGSAFMVGCSGVIETTLASGVAVDTHIDSWTLNMTPANELTDTHIFKNVRVLTLEETNPTLGVTLSGTTLSGVTSDPNAELVQFNSNAWTLHNAYEYITDSERMQELKDDIGTVPGTPILDLSDSIPLLPLGVSATRNAARADIMHMAEGDFIQDWVASGEFTWGAVPTNPVLTDYEFDGQAEYEKGGATTGTIVIPPNIIIQ